MNATLATALLLATTASAQVYGSGVLGSLSPTVNTTLNTTSYGGVFEYTDINIPAGVTVRLTGPNPAILLCQGTVTIAGTLDASAADVTASGQPPTAGGPGGFAGGGLMQPGYGPGGGTAGGIGLIGPPAGNASHAPTYGSAFPFDLRGGSGGGGVQWVSSSTPQVNATGGGGTIVILAAGTIHISGDIRARAGAITVPLWPTTTRGGIGSGGSILIRSLQSVVVTGTVDASTGYPGYADGFLRIDSYSAFGAPVLSGSSSPAPFVAQLPYLAALAQARVGHVFPMRCASAPGDVVSLYVSLGTATIPLPPIGVIELDPTMVWSFGSYSVPSVGHDPLAQIDVPIPNAAWLIGLTFYAQAVNNVGTVAGIPRLSNRLTILISQ